jgi:hypothetical protein
MVMALVEDWVWGVVIALDAKEVWVIHIMETHSLIYPLPCVRKPHGNDYEVLKFRKIKNGKTSN